MHVLHQLHQIRVKVELVKTETFKIVNFTYING